jgi:hypothetical protein
MLQTFPTDTIFAPDVADAPYVLYDITATSFWRTGLCQMPIAGDVSTSTLQAGGAPGANAQTAPPATCVLVRLSKPWGKLVVRFDIVRRRLQPVIPAPESDDSNRILLSARVIQQGPIPLPDGVNQEYRVRGKYIFALLAPIDGSQGFPGVSIPVTTIKKDANALPVENIVNGIC